MSRWITRRLLMMLAVLGLTTSVTAQIVMDPSRPYVYITLDHVSKPSASEESAGDVLWLRLVNNSTIPIRIRAYSKSAKREETGINYAVVLTPEGRLKYLNAKGAVPVGHLQDVSSSELVPSGGSLLFTIPRSDVSEYWYIDAGFRFDLPRTMKGNDPILHVTFSHQEMH